MQTPEDIPDPVVQFHERVVRGEAAYCVVCGENEGIPFLDGRCLPCDWDERTHNMPPDSRLERDLHIQTAFGIGDTETVAVEELVSRDASEWDNRRFRGWNGFRIQMLTVSRLSPLALTSRWIIEPDALPKDVWKSRLIVEPAPTPPESITWTGDAQGHLSGKIMIMRVRLWRVGTPGFLQGLWNGVEQRIVWTLADVGQISSADLDKVWLPALREARKRGRPSGPPESREWLTAAIRQAYTTATKTDHLQLDGSSLYQLQKTIADRIFLPGSKTSMSSSTLRDHLRAYKLSLQKILFDL